MQRYNVSLVKTNLTWLITKNVWQRTPQTLAWFQAVGPSTQATHALLASTTGPIGSRGIWCKGGCPYNTVIQRRNGLSPLDICLHSRTLGFSGVETGVMIILDNLYTALVSDLHKLTALYQKNRHFVETVRNRGDRQTWAPPPPSPATTTKLKKIIILGRPNPHSPQKSVPRWSGYLHYDQEGGKKKKKQIKSPTPPNLHSVTYRSTFESFKIIISLEK